MKYIPTIGLEVHVALTTSTKMFCGCPNRFDELRPNVNTCPICLGHPGTLPTANKNAIFAVARLGLALGGRVSPKTIFDRKSYFYPDLPKGYQISQYEFPIVSGGNLFGVRIRRVHLEEDAGRLLHEDGASLIDFNRAGVPLMELVTEPDVKNAEEAVSFARELQLLVRYLGISDADMEKGHMRIEANISLKKPTTDNQQQTTRELGVKVEVKNINSFKAVGAAIAYELKRQGEVLEGGGEVAQETRGWDDVKMETVSQRGKESAHDYRYLPEPDLPPIEFKLEELEDLKRHLPELPSKKRERFKNTFLLKDEAANDLANDKTLADYFESAGSELVARTREADYALLANYLLSDLRGLLNTGGFSMEDKRVSPEHLGHLLALLQAKRISSKMAKTLLSKMIETGEDPETLMESQGLALITSENELLPVIRDVIAANPKAVADYKRGKEEVVQFLFGQAMAKTKGQADPEALRALLIKELVL